MNKARLRDCLSKHFNLNELRNLCFDLDINHESLAGDTIEVKARELIAYCTRRGRIQELLGRCRELRSNVDWSEFTDEDSRLEVLTEGNWLLSPVFGASEDQQEEMTPINLAGDRTIREEVVPGTLEDFRAIMHDVYEMQPEMSEEQIFLQGERTPSDYPPEKGRWMLTLGGTLQKRGFIIASGRSNGTICLRFVYTDKFESIGEQFEEDFFNYLMSRIVPNPHPDQLDALRRFLADDPGLTSELNRTLEVDKIVGDGNVKGDHSKAVVNKLHNSFVLQIENATFVLPHDQLRRIIERSAQLANLAVSVRASRIVCGWAGAKPSRPRILLDLQLINRGEEMASLLTIRLENCNLGTDILFCKSDDIEFNSRASRFSGSTEWPRIHFPYDVPGRYSEPIRCEIPLGLSTKDLEELARILKGLRDFSLTLLFEYMDMDGESHCRSVDVAGSYESFKRKAISTWKDKQRIDLVDVG